MPALIELPQRDYQKADACGLALDAKQRAAERERDRRSGRLVASFASAVIDFEQAAAVSPDSALTQPVLAALLEDPSHVLLGTRYEHNTYEEVQVVWQQQRQPTAPFIPSNNSVVQGMEHETSQIFARSLSFGRRRCFRLHRFRLRSEAALAMTSALSLQALERATSGVSCEDGGAIRGSNIGGFQDLLASDSALACDLRSVFMLAVQQTAEADRAMVLEKEASVTPPSSPRCNAFAAWMNVSFKGTLNHIHNHGDNSWAAVCYTKVPKRSLSRSEGALLLRLTRGHGARFMEPDEDLHVPYMCLPGNAEAVAEDGTLKLLALHF